MRDRLKEEVINALVELKKALRRVKRKHSSTDFLEKTERT